VTPMALSERPMLRGPGRLKYDKARRTEMLLLPERVVQLNEAAGAILRLCDGRRTIAQIIDELESTYGRSDLRGDILDFLVTAEDRGWVELCG